MPDQTEVSTSRRRFAGPFDPLTGTKTAAKVIRRHGTFMSAAAIAESLAELGVAGVASFAVRDAAAAGGLTNVTVWRVA